MAYVVKNLWELNPKYFLINGCHLCNHNLVTWTTHHCPPRNTPVALERFAKHGRQTHKQTNRGALDERGLRRICPLSALSMTWWQTRKTFSSPNALVNENPSSVSFACVKFGFSGLPLEPYTFLWWNLAYVYPRLQGLTAISPDGT